MTVPTRADRQTLAAAARSIASRGLSHGSTGNVSLRCGDHILVTPTNSSLGTIEPDGLAIVDLDGNAVSAEQPSKEAVLHAAVYRARPDARAIVHTHSLYATAVSTLAGLDSRDALPALTAYYAMRVRALPLVDYFAPGDRRLADMAGETAREHPAMLLRNHGPVVADRDLGSAVEIAEEIEQTSQMFLLLHGRETVSLGEADRAELYVRARTRERE